MGNRSHLQSKSCKTTPDPQASFEQQDFDFAQKHLECRAGKSDKKILDSMVNIVQRNALTLKDWVTWMVNR
jgi:hypothetical protein